MSGIFRFFRALALVAACALSGPASAQAHYVSFVEWQKMPAGERAAYVAGAFDAYVTFSQSYGPSAQHYLKCVQKLNMAQGLLASNVLSFGAARPAIHGQTVPGIMIQYLFQTCGTPP